VTFFPGHLDRFMKRIVHFWVFVSGTTHVGEMLVAARFLA